VPAFSRSVRFEHVHFTYGEGEVLHDVSLEITKGERIALTGPSGAGKSTVADLVLGLYPASSGTILVDGVPIGECDIGEWRRQVALVPQDTVLFNDSLFQNILFGRPDASREEVMAAARDAMVDEFAAHLPLGYENPVGDNGANLSGGQRQRVAIARAFLKNAPVLILDEATSSLDAANENLIARTLERMPRDRTVIIIAHRSATIEQCDKVIELKQGRIAGIRSRAGQPMTGS
jgi:ABC-type multidrug transport system fused ATPase/permease subunit